MPHSTSPTRRPCGRRSATPGRTPSSTPRRTPPSTPVKRTSRSPERSTPTPSATSRRSPKEVGAHLVHVSTDYVFDGTLDRPYREDDATNPQSVYGITKLAGERLAGPDAAVVRTSWVCGEHGNNMVKLVLRLASPGAHLAFVDDQRGCPTFTADLAPALRSIAAERSAGIFHLTNAGPRDVVRVRAGDPAGLGPPGRDGPADHVRRARSSASGAPTGQQRARQRAVAGGRHDPPAPLPRTPARARRRAHVRLRRCPPRASRRSGSRTPWSRAGTPFPVARRSPRCASVANWGRWRTRSSCTTSPAATPNRRRRRTVPTVRSPCSRWRGRGSTRSWTRLRLAEGGVGHGRDRRRPCHRARAGGDEGRRSS